ncbi:MAG: hypothetical protein KAR11_01525 [Phycisphaerae bacterium]|nr:hypothetical protein [Phycisphaerae bacterium]
MSDKRKKRSKPIWLVATGLAWLIPGAGHIYVGRRLRGIILFVVINVTFWTGVGIGGVMTVDSKYERWWMMAQMLTGIDGVYCWYRQDQVYKQLATDPDMEIAIEHRNKILRANGIALPKNPNAICENPTGRPGNLQMVVDHKLEEKGIFLVDPAGELARAFTGIAGMLNLLCIFDAMMLAMMGQGAESTPPRGKSDKEIEATA